MAWDWLDSFNGGGGSGSSSPSPTPGGSSDSDFAQWLAQYGPNAESGGVPNKVAKEDPGWLFPTGQYPSGLGGFQYNQSDLTALSSLPADMMAALQQGLAAAGFLNGDFQLGAWSEKTANAYKNLLEFANMNQITWQEALQLAMNNTGSYGDDGSWSSGGGGGAGGALPPLQIALPNRDDLYTQFENLALSVTDRADPSIINRMTDQYMDYLRDVQEQDYQTQISGAQTQEFSEPMSMEVFAERKLEKEAPGQVRAAHVRDAMETLLASVGQYQPVQREF